MYIFIQKGKQAFYSTYSTVQCTLKLYTEGWSDLLLFSIFEWTHCCRSGICSFMSSNTKNRQILMGARALKFSFSKFTGTLKLNIFLGKFANTFLLYQ